MDNNFLNKEVHFKNNRAVVYFVCHVDGLPILQRMSHEQKQAREERYTKMIDFIERRDLTHDYVKNYRRKMREVWTFANSDSSADGNDDLSIVDEEIEVIEIQDNTSA